MFPMTAKLAAISVDCRYCAVSYPTFHLISCIKHNSTPRGFGKEDLAGRSLTDRYELVHRPESVLEIHTLGSSPISRSRQG